MTVGELKEYLNNFDDRAEVKYFDSEAGEDFPMNYNYITIEDKFEDLGDKVCKHYTATK